MNDAIVRRLPSVDWVAFAVGMAAMALHYLWPPLMLLVGLAVFTPAALREMGLLRDADEFTLGVMRRAGFHALLVAALLIFLNHLLPMTVAFDPEASQFGREPFGGESLRKAVVWVFLISYLIQYWGARDGVFRVLLGTALMTLSPLVWLLRPEPYPWPLALVGFTLGSVVLLVLLAFAVRRWPRAGGGLLLAIFLVAVAGMGRYLADPQLTWGIASSILQFAIVFGATGIALLKETSTGEGGQW